MAASVLFGSGFLYAKYIRQKVSAVGADSDKIIVDPLSSIIGRTSTKEKMASLILPFAQCQELGIKLYLPAALGDIAGIGYHESGNNKAYSLEPIGSLEKNDNQYKVDVSLESQVAEPKYYIMESRGEATSATSVADVAIKKGKPVLSPIDGTVTNIEPIVIYGQYQDYQIEIIPDDHPDLRLAFLHIDQLKVDVGDVVVQGQTKLGFCRDFRSLFESDIDEYLKISQPHVHMQLNKYVPEQP